MVDFNNYLRERCTPDGKDPPHSRINIHRFKSYLNATRTLTERLTCLHSSNTAVTSTGSTPPFPIT
ncbi:hypothetical protein E2C01_021780 [Portunus trituberculatus]|uniref:Uncharacterized protein n=1 Tax=Portunus trituberculatus TaxID=210409 RepID=A0A5B7E3H8_PORTR|nr:hypothetical protein [Portunus trituberculatus]